MGEFGGGVLKGAGSMVGGVANIVTHPVETASGLYAMAEHVPFMAGLVPNPLKLAHAGADIIFNGADPKARLETVMDPGKSLQDDAKFGKALVDGFIEPYKKSWSEGKYFEVAGRATFDIGSMFIGAGEANAAIKTGEVASVAAKTAEVANVAGKTGEVASVASKAGEVANVASKTAEVANVASKTGEVANVASKSGKAAEVASTTGKATEVVETAGKTGKVANETGKGPRIASGVAEDPLEFTMNKRGGELTPRQQALRERLSETGRTEVGKREVTATDLAALTQREGVEHAVVILEDGKRALVDMGSYKGGTLPADTKKLLMHSHPDDLGSGMAKFISQEDVNALKALDQQYSYMVTVDGTVRKFTQATSPLTEGNVVRKLGYDGWVNTTKP
jgi:hypothetical protein